MSSSRKILPLAQICYRQFSQSAVKNSSEVALPRIQKLKENQKKFQVDDGLPVYLKGGFGDKLLFQATSILTLIGMGWSIQTFCVIAFGNRN